MKIIMNEMMAPHGSGACRNAQTEPIPAWRLRTPALTRGRLYEQAQKRNPSFAGVQAEARHTLPQSARSPTFSTAAAEC